jgi:hypothetical protein
MKARVHRSANEWIWKGSREWQVGDEALCCGK